MSEETEQFERRQGRPFKVVAAVVGTLVGLVTIASAIKAWAILPYRIEQLEVESKGIKQEYKDVSAEQRQQREILIRIEERLKRQPRVAEN